LDFRYDFPQMLAYKFILICLLLGTAAIALAAEKPYISVGTAQTKKTVLAFPRIKALNSVLNQASEVISDTIIHDLEFMDLFKFLDSEAFIEPAHEGGITLNSFKFQDWTKIGTEFLIKSQLSSADNKKLTFEVHVFDTIGAKEVFSKKYFGSLDSLKLLSHTFSNDLVHTLTGLPGIFLTKIAMSCEGSGKKEIYMMDFDGSNVKQITRHRSISFAPAWSPKGNKLAYSVYTRHEKNIKNIDLYEFDFDSQTIRLLSNKKGINSGAAYSPDGKSLAVTLSYSGTPSIYKYDLKSRSTTLLTKSLAFDVDPSWNADGSKISFVSSRTGVPMIYSMKSDGTEVQRLTYAGRYNATPSWSPQNNKITFAGWLDKAFDIFIMNPDGTHIERLTKNQASNEDPFFSPDGNFIVFSSNRTGQKNIYVMNVDGSFVKRLTYGLGNCVSPKWSPPSLPNSDE
jgi:TolB protein